MAEVNVSVQAYAKMLLHAAKYPHCSVNGVLLAEDTKAKEKKVIRFVDCVPLFHLSLTLAPMLEAALLQIDSYCKHRGLVIAGYYQASENLSDNELNNVAKHIGKKIHDVFPEACIFLINNNRVSLKSVSEVYTVYTMKESQWREDKSMRGLLSKSYLLPSFIRLSTVDEETLSTAQVLLSKQSYRDLIDFDNHLDDFKNDWRNTKLNELISRFV